MIARNKRILRYIILACFLIPASIYILKKYILFDNKNLIRLHYENCNKYPNDLISSIKEKDKNTYYRFHDIERDLRNMSLKLGGKWSSSGSSIPSRVAIIVPYKNRLSNFKVFVRYMHEFLSRQNVESYGIYFVEPMSNLTFNRALLLNIGFVEASKDENWNCFVFHDVDLLPENDKNFYECDKNYPKQFGISISIYNYSKIDYFKYKYLGGVTGFTGEQFKAINGYSNLYFGWGAEDDDAYARCMRVFKKIARLTPEIGRYFANCHRKEEENSERENLLKDSTSRMEQDGLNTMNYYVIKTYRTKLFTLINVVY